MAQTIRALTPLLNSLDSLETGTSRNNECISDDDFDEDFPQELVYPDYTEQEILEKYATFDGLPAFDLVLRGAPSNPKDSESMITSSKPIASDAQDVSLDKIPLVSPWRKSMPHAYSQPPAHLGNVPHVPHVIRPLDEPESCHIATPSSYPIVCSYLQCSPTYIGPRLPLIRPYEAPNESNSAAAYGRLEWNLWPSTNQRSSSDIAPPPSYAYASPEPMPHKRLTVYKRRNATTAPLPASLSEDPTPADPWKCPYCAYVQHSRRMPDLRRHVATHTRRADGTTWVCCGVPLAAAHTLGIRAREDLGAVGPGAGPVSVFNGTQMVGGCMATFSRRDALNRHLKRAAGRCVGSAFAEWQLGNRGRL